MAFSSLTPRMLEIEMRAGKKFPALIREAVQNGCATHAEITAYIGRCTGGITLSHNNLDKYLRYAGIALVRQRNGYYVLEPCRPERTRGYSIAMIDAITAMSGRPALDVLREAIARPTREEAVAYVNEACGRELVRHYIVIVAALRALGYKMRFVCTGPQFVVLNLWEGGDDTTQESSGQPYSSDQP